MMKIIKMYLILEINEVVLVNCNIVNKDYLQDSKAMYTLVSNKWFSHLFYILPKRLYIFKNL